MDKRLEYCTKFGNLSDIVFLSSVRYFSLWMEPRLFCSYRPWRIWKDRLIIFIHKILYGKAQCSFSYPFNPNWPKGSLCCLYFELPQFLWGRCISSVCVFLGISDKLSNTEGLLTASGVPAPYFTDLFEGWLLSAFPNSSEEQHAFCQLFSIFHLKDSFHWWQLFISLRIALVKYVGISQHGSKSAEYFSSKGCAWRYLFL